jgi:hypothetical protein
MQMPVNHAPAFSGLSASHGNAGAGGEPLSFGSASAVRVRIQAVTGVGVGEAELVALDTAGMKVNI